MHEPSGIIHGDCLSVLRDVPGRRVKLIYLDPPFCSGRVYTGERGEFSDSWAEDDAARAAVDEVKERRPLIRTLLTFARLAHSSEMEGYLAYLALRLFEMKRVMDVDASIYLHCDDSAVHYLKLLMDAVFGDRAFRSHITWKRHDAQNQASEAFGRITDMLLHYANRKAKFTPQFTPYEKAYIDKFYKFDDGDGKGRYWKENVSSQSVNRNTQFRFRGYAPPKKGWAMPKATMEKMHAEGRLCYPVNPDGSPAYEKRITRKSYLSEKRGRRVDNLWLDILNLRAVHSEKIGYPTQKPLSLLERVINASSEPGDLVFDPFAGSGTTLVAAKRLGRRYAGCDISTDAVATAEKRLSETETNGE